MTTLRLNNSLEGLSELSKNVYSQLWFITMKGHGFKSATGKGTQGRVQERLGMETPVVSFQWSCVDSAYFSQQ